MKLKAARKVRRALNNMGVSLWHLLVFGAGSNMPGFVNERVLCFWKSKRKGCDFMNQTVTRALRSVAGALFP